MPCFNEADGITDFLNDICENLDGLVDYLVAVDDLSTDTTALKIKNYKMKTTKIELVSNLTNLGHGPSFLVAISKALSLNPNIVITVDGDGQFQASEIRDKLIYFINHDLDVLECARWGRSDPVFRKFVTYFLRFFIFIRVGQRPMDSNTPLRIYRAPALVYLMQKIPKNSLVPNLRISALTRRSDLKYSQVRVKSLERRGVTAAGSTWMAKRDWLPSKRFVQFCRRAILEILRFPI